MEQPSGGVTQRRIRCKMCRRILAGYTNLLGHRQPPAVLEQTEAETSPVSSSSTGPAWLLNLQCSGYFVQPLQWMEFLEGGESAGKIFCPNERCKAKVGNYDWAGVKCSCGEWVTPKQGFCIHRTKVDEIG